MPTTNFDPGGARGFPIIGAGLGFGWKSSSNIYFVDGTNGSDDNPGTDPDTPFATVEKAVSKITADDVVYITEKGFSGTDPTTYAGADANHTIALADIGVAFVGVSHSGMVGYPMTPYLAGRAATETPIFTVNAPLCCFENLHFMGGWANAYTTTAGIYLPDTLSGTRVPQGINIFNCSFEDMEGAAPTQFTTAPGAGVSIQGTWYTVVNHCRFRNCVVGIQVISAANTTVATTLEHCVFYADNDTDVNCDIGVYCQGTTDILVNDMYFAHRCPAYASGSSLRYVHFAGNEEGLITNCHCANEATLTTGNNGTGMIAPDTVGWGSNYCFAALMADEGG